MTRREIVEDLIFTLAGLIFLASTVAGCLLVFG